MRRSWQIAGVALAIVSLFPASGFAQSASELQAQIDANNAQIAQLNKEITQYQTQLNQVSTTKQTLQNTISQLTLQRKKITASISVTKSQISSTQIEIQQLAGDIANKQGSIESNQAGLAEVFRRMDETETQPLIGQLLSEDTLSNVWEDIDQSNVVQDAVRERIKTLSREKQELSDTKTAREQKQAQLVKQKNSLTVQQGSLDAATKAQNDLLAQTKSQESAYQKILAEKKAQQASFEQAINDLQAKLKAVDTSSVPSIGTGVLAWPLQNVTPTDCTALKKLAPDQSCITQYFGNTEFARSAAYNGQGHNGIDLRAPIGTPVYAALTGTIQEINLGVAPNCQYGKWVLIKHNNGLTTLYAHLSSIVVGKGDPVSTGQLIGYSGQTGYATGPHLHFTVYASSGVSFTNYKCNSGITVKIPVSPFNGYLNPLNYL